jgi:hypothetical protein
MESSSQAFILHVVQINDICTRNFNLLSEDKIGICEVIKAGNHIITGKQRIFGLRERLATVSGKESNNKEISDYSIWLCDKTEIFDRSNNEILKSLM